MGISGRTITRKYKKIVGILPLFVAALAVVATPYQAFAASPQDTYSWTRNIGTKGCNSPVLPYSITIVNGKIYVVDGARYSIDIFDLSGNFISKFGSQGAGDGQFGWLSAAAVTHDAVGNIFIVDRMNYRVQKFDANGNFISKFGSQGSGNGQFTWPNDIAIDGSGNIFVTDSPGINTRVQKFDANGTYISQFGSYGTGNGQFSGSSGGKIAISSTGKVYVSDYNSSSMARIQQFDFNGTYVGQFGSYGTGNGQFKQVTDIAIASDDTVYVGDDANTRVQQFTEDGTYVSQFGGEGEGNGQFRYPRGIAIDSLSGDIYVSDPYNSASWHGRVQRFTSNGVYLSQFSHNFNGDPTTLCEPYSAQFGPDGNLYVLDSSWWNGRGWNNIKVYDPKTGVALRTIGSDGDGDGQISGASGIVIGPGGTIYVADGYNRVQMFSIDGGFLGSFGEYGTGDSQFGWLQGIALDAAGNVYVADSYNYRIQKFSAAGEHIAHFGSQGSGPGQFGDPTGVAVSSNGTVYVADRQYDKIDIFSSDGGYLSSFGVSGNGNGQLYGPMGISVDALGNLYVADTDNSRVQKFDANGNFLATFGVRGSGQDQLRAPLGIAQDADGNVYVADDVNSRISVWNAPIIPSAPQDIAAQPLDDSALKITWSAPAHIGSSPITAYRIMFRVAGSSSWTTAGEVGGSTMTYRLTGLRPSTQYEVQVVAVNAVGDSTGSGASTPEDSVVAAQTLKSGETVGGGLANTGVNLPLIATLAGIMIGGGLLLVRKFRP